MPVSILRIGRVSVVSVSGHQESPAGTSWVEHGWCQNSSYSQVWIFKINYFLFRLGTWWITCWLIVLLSWDFKVSLSAVWSRQLCLNQASGGECLGRHNHQVQCPSSVVQQEAIEGRLQCWAEWVHTQHRGTSHGRGCPPLLPAQVDQRGDSLRESCVRSFSLRLELFTVKCRYWQVVINFAHFCLFLTQLD